MFTGIVEETGRVAALDRDGEAARITVAADAVLAGTARGDSICVNGVCLTVTDRSDDAFTVDAVAETLQRSALGSLAPGDRVNLERAVAVGARLGGHIVQGHVDGRGTFAGRDQAGNTTFTMPGELSRYLVDKGSVTVHGVSLTVVDVGPESFSVALVPTTLAETTLGELVEGDPVNVEVDVLAKYVERLVAPYRRTAACGA
jgi:riboflavin synthase